MLCRILFLLNLPLHALIFVIKAVVRTPLCKAGKECTHFVLVEVHVAGVGVGILVIGVKLAALAATLAPLSVF